MSVETFIVFFIHSLWAACDDDGINVRSLASYVKPLVTDVTLENAYRSIVEKFGCRRTVASGGSKTRVSARALSLSVCRSSNVCTQNVNRRW